MTWAILANKMMKSGISHKRTITIINKLQAKNESYSDFDIVPTKVIIQALRKGWFNNNEK